MGFVGSLFSGSTAPKKSKQIPSPPTGANNVPAPSHRSGYRCTIFPGTYTMRKLKNRKANKTAKASRRKNNLRAAHACC